MKYAYGMYGGKFMPFHKGHLHCVEKALEVCDKLYLILFYNGEQEEAIIQSFAQRASGGEYGWLKLTPDERWKTVQKVASQFNGRVIPLKVDVATCRDENGREDWDKETPLVLNACNQGRFDVVFGSEEEYCPYFKKSYPWAEYHIIDKERNEVPISATKIRNMNEEEAKGWMI